MESTIPRLGLLPQIRCCLFDLDGVVTQTATLHAKAWKGMFDAFLDEYGQRIGMHLEPFEIATDYVAFVDGRPRLDGTRSFLAARGITLPVGTPSDAAQMHSVHGLSNRKNALLLDLIETEGVAVFDDSVRYLSEVRDAGIAAALVTSSANAEQVLTVTGLAPLFDVRIDAHVAAAQGLAGKPAPDTFLFAAEVLGMAPQHAAVFEDAVAGVQAGRAGGFGLVIGVDRGGEGELLRASGADVVVTELTDLLVEP